MEYTSVPKMDEKDNEIVNILTRIGMARNTAKVFVAIKELNNPELDYINVETEKTENRGRPISYFSLKKSMSEIINDMEMIIQERIDAEKQNIERLKTLTENYIYDE